MNEKVSLFYEKLLECNPNYNMYLPVSDFFTLDEVEETLHMCDINIDPMTVFDLSVDAINIIVFDANGKVVTKKAIPSYNQISDFCLNHGLSVYQSTVIHDVCNAKTHEDLEKLISTIYLWKEFLN